MSSSIDEKKLLSVVASLMKVEAASIDLNSPLWKGGLSNSLDKARLDAAIRHHFGITCKQIYQVSTLGELRDALNGQDVTPKAPLSSAPNLPVARKPQATFAVACGVDTEIVEKLPEESATAWSSEFYSANFTSSEIAYCSKQSKPREHFAGRWCAKEALKKADGSFLSVDSAELEVVIDDHGAPSLYHRGNLVNCSLSISHTELIAVAVVVMIQ